MHEAIVCTQDFRRPLPGAIHCGDSELARHRGGDFLHDLVLDVEDVLEVAVVAFRPKVAAAFRFDELGRDAHPIAGLSHAALDDVMDAEFAPHVLNLW